MGRDAFVARFGSVYEHSPWVAERAHALELGPAHDTAQGLAAAMARAFRSASDEERMGALRAHPDLAGLDAPSDAGRERLAALNGAYVERHGFPFVVAVRDHDGAGIDGAGLDEAGIVAAVERRIANDTDVELNEACRQVERIARHRLGSMLPWRTAPSRRAR